ncbi:LysR family transcriptional regulator [Acidihalobacter yilgarnensis]|uniref:LysR family transcriptional regulator n=1 Tax=Acidihalobacter yilgarnensis TaxID=2819280 RepID=UPI0018D2BF71|nr:LysR family transcriptional regulator [Acidihalobacter yilgarnensis]
MQKLGETALIRHFDTSGRVLGWWPRNKMDGRDDMTVIRLQAFIFGDRAWRYRAMQYNFVWLFYRLNGTFLPINKKKRSLNPCFIVNCCNFSCEMKVNICVELRQLRYLLAIAEVGHVGRATQRVHISQPALSQQLCKLERELGVSLFTRHHRGVSPTEAGLVMLEHARRILEQVDQARQAIDNLHRDHTQVG